VITDKIINYGLHFYGSPLKIVPRLICIGLILSILFSGIASCADLDVYEVEKDQLVKEAFNEPAENSRILTVEESVSGAHLKNNVLDLYFYEQNSDVWQYQWLPDVWGESCYHEHFGVYTANYGRNVESEEFIVDQPFSDPGGVPGTVSAILHYDDIQVERKVSLSSGDTRFFEIKYIIKNIGPSTLYDVRFFQTVDFDIPWTADCRDDMAWYDAENDYVIIEDDFKNCFRSDFIHSDRHGVDNWYTEIFEDWDDGNLNNLNNYGPEDPGIGMQYNLGNIASGEEKIVPITVWFGEPVETNEPRFNSIKFGLNNYMEKSHHTESYPDEYNNDRCNVLRRGQNFALVANVENFESENYKLKLKVTRPDGSHVKDLVARKDGVTDTTKWDCTFQKLWEFDPFYQNQVLIWIHIPGNEQVGKYNIIAEIQKNDGTTCDIYGDLEDSYPHNDEFTPEFYVLFNPWSEEDADVYNAGFSEKELNHYVLDHNGYNFHHKGNLVLWELAPQNKEVFDIAINAISGEHSAKDASAKLADKVEKMMTYSIYKNNFWNIVKGVAENNWCSFGGVPEMISYYNSESNFERKIRGQCMDYEALLSSFFRSCGIPSRMLTAYGSGHDKNGDGIIDVIYTKDGKRDPKSEKWGFHCWDEAWINGGWSSVDGLYRVGPSLRIDVVESQTGKEYYDETKKELDVVRSNNRFWYEEYYIVSRIFIHDEINLPTSLYQRNADGDLIHYQYLDQDHVIDSIYTYDAIGDKREEITGRYLASISNDEMSARFFELTVINPLFFEVSCNSSTYQIGDEINATILIKNDEDESITLDTAFAVYEEELSTGQSLRDVFNDSNTIVIPANSEYKQNYFIPYSEYKYAGNYAASAGIYNMSLNFANISQNKFVITGSKMVISAPEIVDANDTFEVTLSLQNVLDIPMNDVDVRSYFPYCASVKETTTNFVIPILLPGSINATTWKVSIPEGGEYAINFDVYSNETGLCQKSSYVRVLSDPFLRVDIETPSGVQKDSEFTVLAKIVNEGDLPAEGVQSNLQLPSELTTSEDLTKFVGDVGSRSNTTVAWNLTANEAGVYLFAINTDSTTDSAENVAFIPVHSYDHDLELSADRAQVEADGELHSINMTVHNLGNVEDSVFFQYLVTNSNISLGIYDGDLRIISQSVTVPANGEKTLTLNTLPELEETGTITIYITSELDPTATDSIDIEVVPLDTIPPESITMLMSNITRGSTWLNFTWFNPSNSDFDHTEIYLNGTFQTTTFAEYFNATGLEPETNYSIGTRTVDIYGNVNRTWVNATATTTGSEANTYDISLSEDWNLISLPLTPADTSIVSVLSPIDGNCSIVWAYDASDVADPWKKYDPGVPFGNDLTTMEPGKGYWIMMTADDVLSISGDLPETVLQLESGWNLVGYSSPVNQPIADALSPFSGNYDIVWAYYAEDAADPWKKYDPAVPFGNDLTEMGPGKGYWIMMN